MESSRGQEGHPREGSWVLPQGVGGLECWPGPQGAKVLRLLTGPKPAAGPAVSSKQVPRRPRAPRLPSAGRRRPCRGPAVHQKGTRMDLSRGEPGPSSSRVAKNENKQVKLT